MDALRKDFFRPAHAMPHVVERTGFASHITMADKCAYIFPGRTGKLRLASGAQCTMKRILDQVAHPQTPLMY